MAGKALFERRRQYAGWKWNRSGIAGTDTLAVRLLRRSGYLPDSQREKGKLEAGSRGKAGKKRASLRSSIFRDDCGNALLLFIWLICPYVISMPCGAVSYRQHYTTENPFLRMQLSTSAESSVWNTMTGRPESRLKER